MGFVGIQTGFASSGRRRSLRKTWMPSDHEGLKRLEESIGLVFRFVIGRSNDPRQMSELRKEIEEYDDFMLLDIEEAYLNLPHKTYEPLSNLLGSEYFLHAYGPLYALSAKVVENLVALRNDSLRMFSNKDVTIGAWMLAMNVYHEHNMALCSTSYSSSSIAVWDLPKCSGLFKPEEQLLALHQMEICSGSPTSG